MNVIMITRLSAVLVVLTLSLAGCDDKGPGQKVPTSNAATTPTAPLHQGANAVQPSDINAVAMKFAGGVYTVPVRINDALTLDFTVDSGASDVSIPADVFLTLARTGTID